MSFVRSREKPVQQSDPEEDFLARHVINHFRDSRSFVSNDTNSQLESPADLVDWCHEDSQGSFVPHSDISFVDVIQKDADPSKAANCLLHQLPVRFAIGFDLFALSNPRSLLQTYP